LFRQYRMSSGAERKVWTIVGSGRILKPGEHTDMAKTGRKPFGDKAKIAYSTKLPEEQVMFLRGLPNAAAWLSEAIYDAARRDNDQRVGRLIEAVAPSIVEATFGSKS